MFWKTEVMGDQVPTTLCKKTNDNRKIQTAN